MERHSTFNLDSTAYDDHELARLLRLPQTTTPFSPDQIQAAKDKLLQQLQQQQQQHQLGFSSEQHQALTGFLEQIAQRLLMRTSTASLSSPAVTHQHGSHFLIEPADVAAGRQAKSTDGRLGPDSASIPPGFMNPINVRSTVQAICIDSRFRPNYYGTKATNFQVTLPAIQRKVVSMRVASIELPMTYYAVSQSQGNNTLLLINNDPTKNPAECWVLTLPDGNYEQSFARNSNAAHIETAMVNAIKVAEPSLLNLTTGQVTPGGSQGYLSTLNDLTYTVNHASGRSVFAFPSPPGATASRFLTYGFSVRFNVDRTGSKTNDVIIQLRLGWQLGYRAAEYNSSPPKNDPLAAVVSEGICLIVGPRYAFVSIDDYQKNTGPSYMVAYNNSVLQDNLITRINLAELQSDVGVYQSSSDPGLSTQLNRTREYFGPVDLQRLHIALYDEYGRIIDLNNMDWSLTLAFELQYA
jgi:hypothetical protein